MMEKNSRLTSASDSKVILPLVFQERMATIAKDVPRLTADWVPDSGCMVAWGSRAPRGPFAKRVCRTTPTRYPDSPAIPFIVSITRARFTAQSSGNQAKTQDVGVHPRLRPERLPLWAFEITHCTLFSNKHILIPRIGP